MKLKQIKTEAELYEAIYADRGTVPQPFCEITTVDGVVKAARVGAAHFRMEVYGTTGIFRETEFEETGRYKLTAKVQGFDPKVTYHATLNDLRDQQRLYGDAVETDDNGIAEVKVLVDDNGNVVREVYVGEPVPPGTARATADEITF